MAALAGEVPVPCPADAGRSIHTSHRLPLWTRLRTGDTAWRRKARRRPQASASRRTVSP